MCELYTITENGHQWIRVATWASPYKDNYEDPFWSKLWQQNGTTSQMLTNVNPTAANIMDLLQIFVINKQYLFQRVIFSNMTYFCINYTNTFFIHTMNYFSVVLRIMFLMCMEN